MTQQRHLTNLIMWIGDGYSFNRYGAGEWNRCIENLRILGHRDTVIKAIMCSTHTRHAADMSGTEYHAMWENLGTFMNWYPEYFTPKALDDLSAYLEGE